MNAVENFLDYLKTDRGYSDETLISYGGDLKKFAQYMQRTDSEITWESVDRDLVREWMAELIEMGERPASVKRRLSAIRSFYRFLKRNGVVEVNPAAEVTGPKKPHTLPTFLREEEIDRLFDIVNFGDTPDGFRDRLILLTFYNTGIRLAELVGLNVEDVDLDSGQMRVFGKRRKERIVPFGKELTENLRTYIYNMRAKTLDEQKQPLFTSAGKRIKRSYVQHMVHERLGAVTTLKKKSPHVLRHTFATVMLNHGADLESIKELLGHESLSTTAIYAHTTFAELKKEYEHAHPRA